MKIALIGYGKMGREIEKVANERGHEITLRIRRDSIATLKTFKKGDADVAIEFTTPQSAVDNLNLCFMVGLPVVTGTTGWYAKFEEVKSLCESNNAALFYATNFSLGVNLFFKVNKYLASLMNAHSGYDVSMEEIHHIHKLDKPSGTAITLAEQIISNISRKTKWSLNERDSDAVFIKDVREGEVPGTHIIRYNSDIDDIEIMHRAHNRKGFALGSVLAAEFLKGRKGVYSMDDLI